MAKKTTQAKILIAAGGTGGHIFPGMAVADALLEHGIAVEWLGGHGLEKKLITNQYPMHTLPMVAFRGGGLSRKLRAGMGLLKAFFVARRAIRHSGAKAVLVMGGYVSAPAGLAAKSLGVPLLIHEQNSVPGLANRILKAVATQVFEAFPGTFSNRKHVQTTGNPLRQAFYQSLQYSRDADTPLRILALGGSQGAQAINEIVVELADERQDAPIEWWHQTGEKQWATYQEKHRDHSAVRCDAFIEDPAAAMQWADVIISRSGALSVSEIAASGRASILVPYPHAVDDHQYHNAQHLAQLGAAVIIRQSELCAKDLKKRINDFISHPKGLQEMAEAAKQLSTPDATAVIVRFCTQLLGQPIK